MKTHFFLFFTAFLIWYCIGVLWLSKIYFLKKPEAQSVKISYFNYEKIKKARIWIFFIPIIVALICPIILVFFHSDNLPMGMLYAVVLIDFIIIYICFKIILPIIKPANYRQNMVEVSNNFQKKYLQVNLLFTLLGVCIVYLLLKSLSE